MHSQDCWLSGVPEETLSPELALSSNAMSAESYQYATGISASSALARQILTEGQPAVDRYLRFLRSGSSDYSIALLRDAGVDLSTPAPVQETLDTFGRYLDDLEALL